MNVKRALEAREQLRSRVRDIYSRAEHFGTLASEVDREIREAHARYAKAPRWVHEFADGYARALSDLAYATKLVYGGWIDGKFYSTHSNRADYYAKNGFEPRVYAELSEGGKVEKRGHYWETPRGMKPYFTG